MIENEVFLWYNRATMTPEATIQFGKPTGEPPFAEFDGKRVGTRVNWSGPADVVRETYPNAAENTSARETIVQRTIRVAEGIGAQFVSTTIGVREMPPVDNTSMLGVYGGTLQRTCPQGENGCPNVCTLAEFKTSARLAANCAVANVEVAQTGGLRVMMTPTEDNIMFGDGITTGNSIQVTNEAEREIPAFTKLTPATAVVFDERSLRKQGERSVSIGQNNADGALLHFSFSMGGNTYFGAASLYKPNLGDRGDQQEVIRRVVEAAADREGITEAEKAATLAQTDVTIEVVAGATGENFTHDITVPEPDNAKALAEFMGYSPEEYAAKHAAGEITREDVVRWQYPTKAEENDFVEWDTEIEGRCRIDYRALVRYTVKKQLAKIGARATISEEFAVDPGNPGNNLPSQQRERTATSGEINASNATRGYSGMTYTLS